jgi:hypothetical protein
MQNAWHQLMTLCQRRRCCVIRSQETARRCVKRTLNRACVGIGITETEIDIKLDSIGVLGNAVIVISAGQQEIAAVSQLRADGQTFPLLR